MVDEKDASAESGEQSNPAEPTLAENPAQTTAATQECREGDTKPPDNKFDRDLVRWTGVVALFTGLLFLASILQFCAMRGQLTVMQGQLRAMEVDQRAWVGAPTIEAIPIGNSSAYKFNIIFRNVGKASTHGLYVDANIVQDTEITEEWMRQCNNGRIYARDNPSKLTSSRYFLEMIFIYHLVGSPAMIATTSGT